MKKLLALTLAGSISLSLVACGNQTAGSSASTSGSQSSSSASSETDGVISSIVNLNEDWLPYDENGNLK